MVKYHKSCRAKFPIKRNLDKLKDLLEPDDKRRSSREKILSTGTVKKNILPSKCIFCRKDRYLKKNRTKENLKSCTQFRAGDKIIKTSVLKNDSQILAIFLLVNYCNSKRSNVPCVLYRNYTLLLYKN